MTLLVLHHTDDVGLGTLAEPLEARDVDVRHVDVTEVDTIDLDGVTGLLLLGGRPAGEAYPDHELEAVRTAVEAEVAVFGICHGADVIATALGGEVAERERPEVGFVAVHRTEPGTEDEVAAGWPDGTRTLALHAHEVVRLPDDAEQLLIGTDGPSLWRVGTAWATSLHPEADAEVIEGWMGTDDGRAMAEAAGVDPDELVDEARHRDAFLRATGVSLLLRWVDGKAR